jgi:glutamyl-tRNA reductase
MKVVLVGAGNLATNLAVALQKSGHTIIQVFSRTHQSAEQLAQRVGASAVTTLDQLAQDADIYIISITDSALASLDYSAFPSHSLVVHTAGSIPMDVIPLKRRGVFYPMQTFSR